MAFQFRRRAIASGEASAPRSSVLLGAGQWRWKGERCGSAGGRWVETVPFEAPDRRTGEIVGPAASRRFHAARALLN